MPRFLLAFSALAFTAAVAHADPVEDRQAIMKDFGKSLGALAPIAKGEKPFDAATVQAALDTIDMAAQKLDVAALFPEGSTEGDTEAAPAIWQNMADFQAKVDKMKADAAAAAATEPTDAAGVGAALGMLGPNCGGCHETYRVKKG